MSPGIGLGYPKTGTFNKGIKPMVWVAFSSEKYPEKKASAATNDLRSLNTNRVCPEGTQAVGRTSMRRWTDEDEKDLAT